MAPQHLCLSLQHSPPSALCLSPSPALMFTQGTIFLSACAALGSTLSFSEDRASWQHRGFKGLVIKMLSLAKLRERPKYSAWCSEVGQQVPEPLLTVWGRA